MIKLYCAAICLSAKAYVTYTQHRAIGLTLIRNQTLDLNTPLLLTYFPLSGQMDRLEKQRKRLEEERKMAHLGRKPLRSTSQQNRSRSLTDTHTHPTVLTRTHKHAHAPTHTHTDQPTHSLSVSFAHTLLY